MIEVADAETDHETNGVREVNTDAETDLEVTGVRESESSGVLVREGLGDDDDDFVVIGLGLVLGDAEGRVEGLAYDAVPLADVVTLGDFEMLADPDTLADVDTLDEALGDAALVAESRALSEMAPDHVATGVPETVIVGDTV